MRKIAAVLMVLIAPVVLLAGSDANQNHVVQLVAPQNVTPELSITGTAIDVSSYKGNAMFLAAVAGSLDNGRTNTFTVQHSTTGSTGWNTVTNLAGTALAFSITGTNLPYGACTNYPCDTGRLRKYVRGIVTRTGGADVNTNGAALYMIAPMKSE